MTEADEAGGGYGGDRIGLLIAEDAATAEAAGYAFQLTGVRIAGRVGWNDVAAGLERRVALDLLMVEAAGVAAGLLAAALPLIDAFARENEARVVVALDEEQIDLVVAQLFGPHVQLLCAPSVADRVAALAVAAASAAAASEGVRLNDSAAENEATQLRRLNEEVARIAEALARLTRRDADGTPPDRSKGGVGDRMLAYGAPPMAAAPVDPQAVRSAIRARRLRDQFFDRGLFEDPAWDMLLDLFAAELERTRVSVSSLCIAAAVAPTTALRWIARMTEAGLFERQPDPFDRRRAFMVLSTKARAGMAGYVAAARRAGLTIG